MNHSKLTQCYPLNRKLTDEERQNQLRQKERLDVEPIYNASTIKFNSTFVEIVDRLFNYRGMHTATAAFISISLFFMLFIPLFSDLLHERALTKTTLLGTGILFCINAPAIVALIWSICKESFRWTHYPIRFNRRNRMVYVFCFDGVVRSAKWDDLFFTLGRFEWTPGGSIWDIRAHALKADRETVEWTFALPCDSEYIHQLKMFWEFVRRYMEEGPASVHDGVLWCHDIATQRETYHAGLDALYQTFNGQPFYQIAGAPIFRLIALGRSFVMKTSKTPVWPDEVEAQCKVDPADPYLLDASNNPDKRPTEPLAVARTRMGIK